MAEGQGAAGTRHAPTSFSLSRQMPAPGAHSPHYPPPNPTPSKLCDPKCKPRTLRASISRQGQSWTPERGQHGTPWAGCHTGCPFVTFGDCHLSPEVEGRTLSLDCPGEPPETGSAAQKSLEGPTAGWQAPCQSASRAAESVTEKPDPQPE